jgi:hypothetical protein
LEIQLGASKGIWAFFWSLPSLSIWVVQIRGVSLFGSFSHRSLSLLYYRCKIPEYAVYGILFFFPSTLVALNLSFPTVNKKTVGGFRIANRVNFEGQWHHSACHPPPFIVPLSIR